LAHDLVDFIDDNFNTHRSADYRAVLGHSSGGYGALICALLKADVFKYIVSSAGDSMFDTLFPAHIKDVIIMAEKHGSIEKFLKWFFDLPAPGLAGQTAFNAMLLLAMAPCYAPNTANKPLYGDVFFDLKTGVIDRDIFAKYLAWDPINMIDANIGSLKSLKYLHLDAGRFDEYSLQLGHRQIAAKLVARGVAHKITEYDGGHSGHAYRFAQNLQELMRALGGGSGP